MSKKVNKSTLFSQVCRILVLFALIGCTRSTDTHIESKRLKQSNWVVEDEINGRISRGGNILESTNFLYNNDGTLSRMIVYDDTNSNAILIKDVFFEYQASKVIVRGFHTTTGYFRVDFNYNSLKQVVSILDTNGFGLHAYYNTTGLMDSLIMINAVEYNIYYGFIYDINNNLTQYDLAGINHIPIGRASIKYGANEIPEVFDLKFYSSGIHIIYTGGVNIIPLMGLNTGVSNTNNMISRKEINLSNHDTINSYHFGYQFENNELLKRNIQNQSDTLFYQFKY